MKVSVRLLKYLAHSARSPSVCVDCIVYSGQSCSITVQCCLSWFWHGGLVVFWRLRAVGEEEADTDCDMMVHTLTFSLSQAL